MHYADLVQLYFERSNALQWYWTLYVVIIGGLLAFSSLRVRRDAITGLLVTLLFCMFAYKNLGAIHDTTLQRMAALDAIHQLPADSSDTRRIGALINPTLVAPDYEGIRNFHIASDLVTIAALWAMELRRRRAARENDAAHSSGDAGRH
ncbi:MAG TPA: hypothetical protein VFC46_11215 [Humisphaera sp.]|nr:hypothetical protein [Humisphaera sp.]